MESLWPALDVVFSSSNSQEITMDVGDDKLHSTDHQSCDEAQRSVEPSSQVDDLGIVVQEKLSIGTEIGSDDFETSLRGSGDDSWVSQSISLPSLQPKYLDVLIKEVCHIIVVNFFIFSFIPQSVSNTLGSNNFSFTESVQGFTMASPVVNMAAITNRRVLTSTDAQKTVLELELDWSKVSNDT